MKTKWAVGLLVVTLAAVSFVAHSEDATTVTGEPVDIACYLGGKAGEGHAACASACAAKGNPLGLAVKGADGKETLYLVMGGGGKQPKDLLGTVMGKQVKATGTVAEKGGMKIITVTAVEPAK